MSSTLPPPLAWLLEEDPSMADVFKECGTLVESLLMGDADGAVALIEKWTPEQRDHACLFLAYGVADQAAKAVAQ
jgi:hypothetical protein